MTSRSLEDYETARADFSCDDIYEEAAWNAPDELDIAHEYPREIEFQDELPKTVTGKIRRTELRSAAEAESHED